MTRWEEKAANIAELMHRMYISMSADAWNDTERLIAAALTEAYRLGRAEGGRDAIFEAAERWGVDPERPNYREAVAAAYRAGEEAMRKRAVGVAENFKDGDSGYQEAEWAAEHIAAAIAMLPPAGA